MFLTMLFWSFNANAWFFFLFPIPSFSGSGDTCISSSFKVGDSIPSPIGKDNNAVIKSISGTSSKCKEPFPKLATVQFNIMTSSKAGIDIPDDYEQQKQALTDLQKFNGIILIANSKTTRNKGFIVFYRQRGDLKNSPESISQAAVSGMSLTDTETKNEQQLSINGMNAWRFEFSGKLKGVFGSRETYQITILEGDNEYVVISGYTPESNYENEKEDIGLLAYKISNIKNETNLPTTNSNEKTLNSEKVPTQDLKLTIEAAKVKCKALGFEEKTEKFGSCVLEILK